MRRSASHLIFITFPLLLVATGLVACGGGGSSGSGAGTLLSQTLTFSDPSPADISVGQLLANPASGDGTGAITYSSSNTSIATVNSSGTVTAVAAGSVTISASIAADATYDTANANYSLTVNALPVALIFASSGPVAMIVGDVNTNVAISPSAGAITYSSSNASIADVDVNGQVTAYSAGSVTITADQVANGIYPADSVNYQVDVVASSFTMTTWIGANDTSIDFSAGTDGIEFYRSTDANCDINNYASCSNGQLNILNVSTVTDTALNSTRAAFYTFKQGSHQVSTDVSNQQFIGRNYFGSAVLNGKIYIAGGATGYTSCINDVWSSADGSNWTQLTRNAAFSTRSGHKMVSFNNRLWVIGGKVPDIYGYCSVPTSDVWYSEDGVSWTRATANAGFVARYHHALVVFNNKLWVIGGVDAGYNSYNDVWSSSDGINWTLETAAAAFSPRKLHNVMVLNNTLYLAGGGAGKDVWSSTDGVNWTEETADGGFTSAHTLAVFDDKLWINNFTTNNEMWYSTNGKDWFNSGINSKFARVVNPELVAFDNKLFFLGGATFSGNVYKNDSWYITATSTQWSRAIPGANYPWRYGHAGVSFKNKLWVISGYDRYEWFNDIWSSSDGITWSEEVATTPFSARLGHEVIEFNNTLWLFGGTDYSGTKYDEWSSSDGISWSEETPDTVIADKYGYQLAVFNGKLWLFGGRNRVDDSFSTEVWNTSDGLSWTQELTANYPGRTKTNVAVYNNMLWMVGGTDSGNPYLNDVWSSPDGVNWTQVNASAPFSARFDHQYFVLNNKLWISGGSQGSDFTTFNDVWSTSDGVTWTEENASSAFAKRSQHPVVELNGQIWILGGYLDNLNFYRDIWTTTDGVNWYTPLQTTVNFP